MDQGTVILTPFANTVAEARRSSCYAFILATEVYGENLQQRPKST